MTKELEQRVIKEGTVDTEGYRYEYIEIGERKEIQRLALADLDNVFLQLCWETVKVLED